MTSYEGYIECREGHNGGYPVLKRLNLAVRVVVEMSRRVEEFQQLREALPQCTSEELQAALDYYNDHVDVIEEDIERNRRAWKNVTTSSASADQA